MKNTTIKEKISFQVFIKWLVDKYQLCKHVQRFELYLEKKMEFDAKILLMF